MIPPPSGQKRIKGEVILPGSIAEQISAALGRGATVLTSNERAARTFRQRFATSMSSPQQVLSISAWIAAEWQRRVVEGVEDRVPLSAAQELRVWDQIIAKDGSFASLLPSSTLADLAMSANVLLARWEARQRLQSSAGSGDAAIFRRWFGHFEHRCADDAWVGGEALVSRLASSISSHPMVDAPSEIVLTGFDELLPSQRSLLNALSQSGVRVTLTEAPPRASSMLLATFDTLEDEFAQCARWAGVQSGEGRRVAIVHSDPASVRPALERALRLHADTPSNDIAQSAEQERFEFSLGAPLSAIEMVRHTLLLLRLAAGSLDLESASELLRSRYLFSLDTRIVRAEFDAFSLRRDKALRTEVTPALIARLMLEEKHERASWPALHPLAEGLRRASALIDSKKHLSWNEWADAIRKTLEAAHFVAQRGETSFEFQVRRRWTDLLDELSRLQAVDREVPWATALRTLERMCAAALFAPESKDAPIQVMSPTEAAGSSFDALWLLDADDKAWPATASPHPLLPFILQAETGMPGASWEKSSERAATTAERLMRSAAEVVVSYARTTATGEHAHLSKTFRREDFTAFVADDLPLHDAVELMRESADEAVPAPPATTLRGGARVLELQAACSFRAMAELRLFSAAPGEASDGMDAGVRGEAVHTVLERFWYAVGSRKALAAISAIEEQGTPTRRQKLLEEIVDDVIRHEHASAWEQQYIALERERILGLVNRWLDFELHRADFSIHALEHTLKDVAIGPLHINLRVDRIDRLHLDGDREGLLLIDYKTSPHSAGKWEGERPDQPQLPLYAAVIDAENLVGLAFANLTPGEKKFGLDGISNEETLFGSKHTRDLSAEIPAWHGALEILADEFASGTAHVNPKRPNSTCRYCEQHVICRVHSLGMVHADEESRGEGGE